MNCLCSRRSYDVVFKFLNFFGDQSSYSHYYSPNMSKSFELVNFLGVMSGNSIGLLVFGYFRIQRFFEHNVRCDDFINIISKYITEKKIKIGNNNTNVDVFDGGIINYVDALNKQFFVANQYTNQQTYVRYLMSLYCFLCYN